MNANIFKHEFSIKLKSAAIWSLSMIGLIVFYFALFPVFADQAQLMKEFLARYPQELQAAFGLDKMDMTTVLGFFAFTFMFVQLCMAIQAANYGVGLVSIEETELTADFLLSKPVSRVRIMTSKLLAALACLVITDLVILLSSFIAITIFRGKHEYEAPVLLLIFAGLFIFQLFFLGVGLVISLLVKRVRSVTPYALGLGFGAYVLSAFSGIFGDIKLEYITPFKHFDTAAIVSDGALNTPLVVLNVAVTVIALVASFWLYLRRDVPAVS